MEIRLAQMHEVPALQTLIARSSRQLGVGFYTPRQIELALLGTFSVDEQLIADGTYYVIVDGERYAGCGGWSKRRKLHGGDRPAEGAPAAGLNDLLDPAVDTARIRAFFIDPDYARRGLGRQLLTTCEMAAQAAGFTRSAMGATLSGVPLYEACGYHVVEELLVPLPENEFLPIVHMEKTLNA
ncbi:MAG: GNAT family N-acetyltransferase [Acidobacteria bacterium]|nr:GNAT family N-acetyltransferase [Acidobacteriota bacterium]